MIISLPVAVHVFLKKNNQILLIKRARTGFQDGKWSIPAGRLEAGESIMAATIREAKEEVGVNINREDFSAPLFMHHKDDRGERIYVFFIVENWIGEPRNLEPEKCDEIKFHSIDKLPESIIDHVKIAFNNMSLGLFYIEYGFKL